MENHFDQSSDVNKKPAPEVKRQLDEIKSENLSSEDSISQQAGTQPDYKASRTQEPTGTQTATDKKRQYDKHTENSVYKETGENSPDRDQHRPYEDYINPEAHNNEPLKDQFTKRPDKE